FALHDVIDIDVSPAAGRAIDDLDGGFLADKFLNVPRMPIEVLAAARLIVGAGSRADDFAADEQVEAGFAGEFAAADEEIDEIAFDVEQRRRERAGAGIAAEITVDKPFAQIACDGHLVGECAARRTRAERSSGGLPGAVVGA